MIGDPVIIVVSILGLFLVFLFLRRFIHLGKIERIEKIVELKQYDKAIPYLKNLISKDDENIMAHYYLGICYFNINNYEWAMPEFKKVLRSTRIGKDIQELPVREKLARIYLNYNQLEEAQKEFMLMTQIDPKNYKNYYEIASILHKQGYLDAAYTYYQKALERNPKLADAYYNIGLIAYDKKRYNDALSFMSDAIKYDSSMNKARYYTGMIYYASKNFEKALAEFSFSERDPETKQKTMLQKGKIYAEMGQNDRAINLFESYLKGVSTENSITLSMRYNLANIYESKRNILSAIEQWEKISKFKPNYLDVQDKLAEYEDLRVDDRLKDFMVASCESFQIICRNILEMWNYQIIREDLRDDSRMEFLATEPGSKWRNTRKIRVFVIIMRRNNKIEERELADILDTMKLNNAMKGICVCIAGFSDGAQLYAQSRPIDLINKEKFTKILEQTETFSKEKIKGKLNQAGNSNAK